MKVLFIATECTPFIKTGGLADVIGALPQALEKENVEVRVMLPKYVDIPTNYKEQMKLITVLNITLGWRNQYCGLWQLKHDHITYYFIDNEYYFKRSSLYGHGDDAERFAFFNRAVMELLPYLDFQPDILHANDWHAGLISLYLQDFYRFQPFYQNMRSIFTIHNLMYQGIYPPNILGDLLGLGSEYLAVDKMEYFGQVNFMKAALQYADRITTVSPSYAEEIQTAYYGEHLDGLLRKRSADLYGIINGIDIENYNPLTDRHLVVNYSHSESKKQANKVKMQEMLHLPVNAQIPMIAIVSRLVEQKGFDLVAHILDEIVTLDMQLIILGTGEYKYEQLFREAAHKYPDKISALITFNEGLSHQIYASSDLFLMPSRFEPCGIGQLIALRYGSAPIVRETGGLKDTIKSFNEYTREGNGFTFTNFNAHDLLHTIHYALHQYHDKNNWNTIKQNIQKSSYSWQQSAKAYKELYLSTLVNHDL